MSVNVKYKMLRIKILKVPSHQYPKCLVEKIDPSELIKNSNSDYCIVIYFQFMIFF